MDRRESLDIITGGINAKAARERGERVESAPIEQATDPDYVTALMSAVLSDKARQTEARLKAEREAAKAEEIARMLKLEVEGKTERPEVTRHREHAESQQHIGDFVTELLKTRGQQ
jgi:hypothetical protein